VYDLKDIGSLEERIPMLMIRSFVNPVTACSNHRAYSANAVDIESDTKHGMELIERQDWLQ
jgi:hypothetical protein